MKRKYQTVILIWLAYSASISAQIVTLNSNQALPLTANAGNDTTIISGRQAILGAHPSAENGYGGYTYHWTPSAGLSNVTQPNPIARPLITTKYLLTVTDMKNCTSSDQVTITVEANGISENEALSSFKVYPNPSDGNIRVDLDGVSGPIRLRVINSIGVTVYEIDREIINEFREELDTRFLSTGNYVVILVYKSKIITRTIVIL